MIILNNEKFLGSAQLGLSNRFKSNIFLSNNLVKLQQHEVKSKNEHIAKVQRVCGNEK